VRIISFIFLNSLILFFNMPIATRRRLEKHAERCIRCFPHDVAIKSTMRTKEHKDNLGRTKYRMGRQVATMAIQRAIPDPALRVKARRALDVYMRAKDPDIQISQRDLDASSKFAREVGWENLMKINDTLERIELELDNERPANTNTKEHAIIWGAALAATAAKSCLYELD
jgi:hypothetical protein